jgi:parallel beta-helix repeat protein
MKIQINILAIIALFSIWLLPITSSHAQGTLMPPGAPAPTMKTADQIYDKLDPRIPVSTNTTPGDANDMFVISQPGSYYLTTNIVGVSGQHGITITANFVTLDLNGFVMQGVPDSKDGIQIGLPPDNSTHITVRNGMIIGWENGVVYTGSFSVDTVVEHLSVSGCAYDGIALSGNADISDCCVNTNLGFGITSGGGIISNCRAVNNAFVGILASKKCLISGCVATGNTDDGIQVVGNGSVVLGNVCNGNNSGNDSTSGGIYVAGDDNRIENNNVSSSGLAGIVVNSGSGNIIIKNSVSGNGVNNYVTDGLPNVVGPILNDSNGNITNSSPWGNFSF